MEPSASSSEPLVKCRLPHDQASVMVPASEFEGHLNEHTPAQIAGWPDDPDGTPGPQALVRVLHRAAEQARRHRQSDSSSRRPPRWSRGPSSSRSPRRGGQFDIDDAADLFGPSSKRSGSSTRSSSSSSGDGCLGEFGGCFGEMGGCLPDFLISFIALVYAVLKALK